MLLDLVLGAAVLGVIITVMEHGEPAELLPLMGCMLAAAIPAAIINHFLPLQLFVIGLAVGAVCAGFAVSAVCGMSFKRSTIAVGIYFAVMIVLHILWHVVRSA